MMEKWHIGQLKKSARLALKKDYWRMIFVCFIAAIVCSMYAGSTALIDNYTDIKNMVTGRTVEDTGTVDSSLDPYATPSTTELLTKIREEYTHGLAGGNEDMGDLMTNVVGQSINTLFPNKMLAVPILQIIATAGTSQAGLSLFVFAVIFAIGIALDIFFISMLKIGHNRYFMETRTYHDTKILRIFYPYQIGRIGNPALIMFLRNLFQFLWSLTVIGGIIKHYEYKMIPFILAENPDIDRKTCFKMSKEMMRGNKWHAFLMDASFSGWYILSLLTFGIVQVFFLNPFYASSYTELYFELRSRYIAKGGVGAEKLCDIYLTERPSFVPESVQKGIRGGLARTASGIRVGAENAASLLVTGVKKIGSGMKADFTEAVDAEKAALSREQANAMQAQIKAIGNEDVYPIAISPVQPTERAKEEFFKPIRADRKYSLTSYILMFFLFSFVGWVWEVSLCFAQSGLFVNRGVMMGPWLPIYGTGGIIVLLFMRKWMHRPVLTFVLVTVSCVTVEYFTALAMWEIWHTQYWDYSTEFMNLQGRICLKGAIAFGIGGMAFMYFLAPRIDDLVIEKIPKKIRNILCIVLVALFGADALHSAFHPNTGAGITSMLESSPDDIVAQVENGLKDKLGHL